VAKTIAIVEDEQAIRENYAASLRKQGYEVDTYSNRPEATRGFDKKLPDLVLLDIGLENEIDGGFELCRALRSSSSTLPIIFLTARDSDLDIISGLRLGADDYLTKDISIPHLCARIAAFFRRQDLASKPPAEETILKRGDLSMDMDRFSVHWQGEPVDLTLTEFWMVHTLALHPGHVKNREQLMQEAKIVVDDATITSHIKRIRKKFQVVDKKFDCVDTVYGMGYRWVEQ
jgi:two-component system OmpR family response regulator